MASVELTHLAQVAQILLAATVVAFVLCSVDDLIVDAYYWLRQIYVAIFVPPASSAAPARAALHGARAADRGSGDDRRRRGCARRGPDAAQYRGYAGLQQLPDLRRSSGRPQDSRGGTRCFASDLAGDRGGPGRACFPRAPSDSMLFSGTLAAGSAPRGSRSRSSFSKSRRTSSTRWHSSSTTT